MSRADPTPDPSPTPALRRRADRMRFWAVVGAMILTTVIATVIAHQIDVDRERAREVTASEQAVAAIETSAARLEDTVRDLTSLFAASENVTTEEFFAFAEPALEAGAASGLSRIDLVDGEDRTAFERRFGRPIWEPAGEGRRRAPERDAYAVIVTVAARTLARPVVGYNVLADADGRRAAALRASARAGEPVASGVVPLAASGRAGFVVFSPRYEEGQPVQTPAERQRALVGWVSGALDYRQLGLAVRTAAGRGGLRLSQGGTTLVSIGEIDGDPVRASPMIAGTRWQVELSPDPDGLIPVAAWVALLGILGTIFVALLMRQAAISEHRSRQLATLRGRERDEAVRTGAVERAATQALLGHLPDIAMYRYDPDLRFTTVAGGLINATGRTSAQLVGCRPSDIATDEEAAVLEPTMRAAIDGASHSFAMTLGGRRLWVQTVPLTEGEEALLVATDVTGLERAQAGRAEAEARFQQAFDDAPVGMSLMDLQGRFIEVNRALCEMTGYDADELRGRNFSVLSRSEDVPVLADALRQQAAGETHRVSTEARAVHASGDTIWLEIHATTLAGPDGRPALVLSQVLDVTDRRRFEARIQYMADHDPLTGMANRRAFERALDTQLANVRRYGAQGALLVFDLDHFKAVNDTLGHTAGDAVIVNAARILKDLLRESDVVARLGGDEFAILLPRADHDEAVDVARKLVAEIRANGSVLAGQRPGSVTASVGVTLLDPVQETGEQALVDADLAMYDAKEAGRDRFAVFRPGSEAVQSRTKSRLTWLERIRTALEEDAMVLVAQPIQSLADERAVHHELLLRMVDAHGDLIPPSSFLHIAERFGLIEDVDIWVVRHAIRALAERAGQDLIFEVNLSGASIGSSRVLEVIEQELRDTGVDPQQLIFEITETAAVSNVAEARVFAERLGELGCRFALDDFGAGFGSFYYLKHLPCDFLKIDGEFIRNLSSTPTDQVIVAGLVRIAQGLGKQTIAEFVGDQETVDLLRREGVDMAQGYFIGRPGRLEDVLGPGPGVGARRV
ncbi:MAG: EAL domain-containing protein [Solirubrobacteraceae bacterium]|nr:EAL domain-containing protein [Solirubrobacteraceae bacterium]